MRSNSDRENRGITLVELILAILLLNVIVLAGMTMELATRRILTTADAESELTAEAGAIVTMVTKRLNSAIGTTWQPYLITNSPGNSWTYTIRMDTNGNGRIDAADTTQGFRYYINGNNQYRIFLLNNGLEVQELTRRAVTFSIIPNFGEGTATVTITLRQNPAAAASVSNTEANVVSYAQVRGASVN